MSIKKYLPVTMIASIWLLAVVTTSCGSGRHTVSRGNYRNDDIYYSSSPSTPRKPAKSTAESAATSPAAAVTDMSPVVAEAFNWLGTKYRSGGTSRAGTDCSGLVWTIYADIMSIKMPRTAWEQQIFCQPVSRSALMPGDLVFFSPASNGRVSHVGIYIGHDEMIHASSTGVIRSSLSENYYRRHFHSAGRVGGIKGAPAARQQKTVTRSSLQQLDETLTEMTDSILSSYMD